MVIVEFRVLLERRFHVLGDPSKPEESSCCPLGLLYDDPTDLSPEPAAVADKSGLPLAYCVGVAEGWDNAQGFYPRPSSTHKDRAWHDYMMGYSDGTKARRKWFETHPRTL